MRRLDEKGFTLMEAMILSSILLALIVSYAAYQFQINKEKAARDARNIYKQFETTSRSKAGQLQALSKSEELDSSTLQ